MAYAFLYTYASFDFAETMGLNLLQGRGLSRDRPRDSLAEQQTGRLIGFFTGLALLIACAGLFALATFLAEQRTKEIGIRKVLGASIPSLFVLLTGDLLKLVALAFLAAVPLAYFSATRWLEHFAYRIDLSVWMFLFAGVLALLVAFATVGYQATRAALADPVQSLRYE